ncbi:hypothetical protein D3C71_1751180 [compost metagenome]
MEIDMSLKPWELLLNEFKDFTRSVELPPAFKPPACIRPFRQTPNMVKVSMGDHNILNKF